MSQRPRGEWFMPLGLRKAQTGTPPSDGAEPVAPGWYEDTLPDDKLCERYWSGEAWTDRTRPLSSVTGDPQKWPRRVGGAVGVLLVLGLVGLCAGPSDSDGAADETGAYIACQGFVENQLKSPSSADFHRSETIITSTGTTWTVAGPVDADNSFGASLRMDYTCVIRLQDETWHLESLTGLS